MGRNLAAPQTKECVVCGRSFESRQESAVACRIPGHSILASSVRKLAREEVARLGHLKDSDVSRLVGRLQKWLRQCCKLAREQGRIDGESTIPEA